MQGDCENENGLPGLVSDFYTPVGIFFRRTDDIPRQIGEHCQGCSLRGLMIRMDRSDRAEKPEVTYRE